MKKRRWFTRKTSLALLFTLLACVVADIALTPKDALPRDSDKPLAAGDEIGIYSTISAIRLSTSEETAERLSTLLAQGEKLDWGTMQDEDCVTVEGQSATAMIVGQLYVLYRYERRHFWLQRIEQCPDGALIIRPNAFFTPESATTAGYPVAFSKDMASFAHVLIGRTTSQK